MRYHTLSILTVLLLSPTFTCFVPQVTANSIVPAADGVNTSIRIDGDKYNITGGKTSANGTNLFHSFAQFGLQSGEIANFIANPTVQNILSRVVGGNASVINGLIQVTGSNANLFLMNPSGIIFGKSASLQVPAAFTATTANEIGLGDKWFSNSGSNNYAELVGNPGTFAFTNQEPGSIINTGNLAVNPGAGLTFLAGTILNLGQLSAPGGQIVIAAVPGQNLVRLSLPGTLLSLEIQPTTDREVSPSPLSLPALLTGNGVKQATNLIVDSDGTIQLTNSAKTVLPTNGMAIASNNINVSGQVGGTVGIFADKVGLIGANINASGINGGGTVFIGGGSQGKGNVPNASFTYVSHDSLINADSLVNGNGGKVVVWADNTTRFYGNITARGGALSGNGGFVETSGKNNLDILGASVNASAPKGEAGTWFLDPLNITIVDQQTSGINSSGGNIFTPINNNAVISPTTITTALDLGQNVNITTTGTTGSQAGDITVSSPIVGSPTGLGLATLTLNASNNILINAPIQAVIGGKSWNVNLNAGNDINFNAPITTLGGNLTTTSKNFPNPSAQITTSNTGGSNASNINVLGSVNINTGSLNASQGTGNTGNSKPLIPNSIDVNASEIQGDVNSVVSQVNIVINKFGNTPLAVLGTLPNNIGLSPNVSSPLTVLGTLPNNIGLSPNVSSPLTVLGTLPNNIGLSPNVSNPLTVLETLPNNIGLSPNVSNPLTVLGTLPNNIGLSPNVSNPLTVLGTLPNNIGLSPNVSNPLAVLGTLPNNIGLSPNISNLGSNPGLPPNPPNPGLPPNPPNQENLVDSPNIKKEGGAEKNKLSLPNNQVSNTFQPKLQTDLANLENKFVDEFTNHLAVPPDIHHISLNETSQTLNQIDLATGVKPAIIYISFVQPSDNSQPDDSLLQLILVTSRGNPIRKQIFGVKRAEILKVAKKLRLEVFDQRTLNSKNYLSYAEKLYQWIIAPLETELQARQIKNITFIADSGLRFIPLAALYDGKQFLIEKYSIGLMPSLSLTDTSYTDLRKTQVLAMGASRFTDTSELPLPAVPTELKAITQNIWTGTSFINQEFTLKNIQVQKQSQTYGILHLATHGKFNGGSLNSSYIQLWDQKLRLDQIRQIIRVSPPVELLVLSACRTALGNDQAELGFAGFALAAGVKSAIASLWNVSDAGTLALMTEFYRHLKTAPIKTEALRQAQIAMIKGNIRVEGGYLRGTTGELPLPSVLDKTNNDLSHPYYWAGFTMIGNPW